MTLQDRIRRLEDREAIRELVARYGLAMDERDMDEVRRLFAPDATLRSEDGVFAATGIDEIVATFEGRWAALGPTLHVAHGQTISLDDHDADRATGRVTSHAEVVRDGTTMVAAVVYADGYVRLDGEWRFADRNMAYFYYVPVETYAETLPRRDRMLAYGEPAPASFPDPPLGLA